MDTKQLAIGTIAGAVTLYVAGYLIFDLATADYYLANHIAVPSAYRDATLQWAIALGNIPYAVLITLCIASRPGVTSIASGLVTGGVIGFLVWFHADWTLYGLTNVWTLVMPMVDPLFEFVHAGIAGAVIAAVLAKIPKAA